MATTILDYKGTAAPNFKSGAGTELLRAASSDVANAGKLFQAEMARRAEAEFNAQKQAEAVRQFNLTHALNQNKYTQDSMFNDARLEQMRIENQTRQAQANTAALAYQLDRDKHNRLMKYQDMVLGKGSSVPNSSVPSTSPDVGYVATPEGVMQEMQTMGYNEAQIVAQLNKQFGGQQPVNNAIPAGTVGVPYDNGIMAPQATAVQPKVTAQSLFGDYIPNSNIQAYGKGVQLGASVSDAAANDEYIIGPILQQGQSVINSQFTDFTKPEQLKAALAYADSIPKDERFASNPKLGLDLQSKLRSYIYEKQKDDQQYWNVISAENKSRQEAADRQREISEREKTAREEYAKKQAQYKNYAIDLNDLMTKKFGDLVEPKYSVSKVTNTFSNLADMLTPKDRYYFYQNLVPEMDMRKDWPTKNDPRINAPNASGTLQPFDIDELSPSQKQWVFAKYIPSNAIDNAIKAAKERGESIAKLEELRKLIGKNTPKR